MNKIISKILLTSILLIAMVMPIIYTQPVLAASDEIIRPDADGVYSQWTPTPGARWQNVDDITPDENTTVNYKDGNDDFKDSFTFPSTSGSGIINYIRIYVNYRGDYYEGAWTLFLRVGGTDYFSTNLTQVVSWTTGYKQWDENPDTSTAWTWSDLDSIEAGYRHRYGDSYMTAAFTQLYIVINYTELYAPEVTTDAASNIASTTARLNSTVDYDGGQACDIRFGYGTTSQATIDAYDEQTDWVNDTYSTGEHPYVDIDTLIATTQYFYNVEIRNDHSTVLGTEDDFTTESSVAAVSNFQGIPTATTIALSWAKGTGATNTLIRYSYTSYPATTADGIQLYFSTGSTTTHTGLDSGKTVYYTAWGESGTVYSSAVNLLMTTLAGIDYETSIGMPIQPTNWFTSLDYTTMSGFTPIYNTVNGIADGVSMPKNTVWFLGAVFISIGGTFAAYNWKKDLFSASIILVVMLGLFSVQHLVYGWFVFASAILPIAILISRQDFR